MLSALGSNFNVDCMQCSYEDPTILPSLCQPALGFGLQLFMILIETIVRTQCSIADPCRRIKSPKSPYDAEYADKDYDFIIIGGGPAGSVLAARLSENPHHKVLLLEAGPEEPAGLAVPMFFFSGADSSVDWGFETVPQKNACLATDKICKWPRGKMICGTACLSGMMYTRGSPEIYDEWGSLGNTGWNYPDALHYFKKAENNTERLNQIEPDYHGFSGPMSIGWFPHLPTIAGKFLSAAEEIGYEIHDLNGRYQTGFTRAPIMVKDGVRASPNRMYLRPALARKNLRVLIESHVVKIDFNEKGDKAVGVQFRDKWSILHKFHASKEVIVAGGVVGSPQLLLLSGVGPKQHLEKHNIKVVKDLPVGENLHYHFGLETVVKMKNVDEDRFTPKTFYEYVTKRTGPFASTGLTQITAFIESSYAKPNVPDIQLYFDQFSNTCDRYNVHRNVSTVTLRPVYLITKCRGTIKLKSSDPFDSPLIDPNYLCNQTEIEALIESVRLLQKLVNATGLKKHLVEFDAQHRPACQSYVKGSDDYWRCVVRQYTAGENHHAGSCKMGPAGDPTAVVDPQFRVHGISNLRVIDASVMPTPINCNTIAPVIMFAEKGSDLIKRQYEPDFSSRQG